MFSLACRAVGFRRVVLVDDFTDPVNDEVGEGVPQLHRSYGVEVEKREVLAEGLLGLGSRFNAI
jgi:hypothetical protein